MSGKPNPLSGPRLFPAQTGESAYLTPPSSPRKRRALQRSSQETRGWMTLKDYLMRMDVFRVTVPVAEPLPLKVRFLDEDHPLEKSIETIVSTLLSEYHVTYEDVGFCGVASGVMLRISSTMTITRSWGPACRRIHRELLSKGFNDICVEIINPDKAHVLRQYSIPDGEDGDAVIRRWHRAKNDVMGAVSKKLELANAQWDTVCVFMCGRTVDKSSPTVVITVDLAAFADWSQLTIDIQAALLKHDVKNFDVEFTTGKITPSKAISILSQTGNGDSIGIVGDEACSGTPGGFVELEVGTPAQVRLCAMTCHHVSRSEVRSTQAFANALALQPPNTLDPHAIQMRSPSQRDFEDSMGPLEEAMEELLTTTAEIEEEKRQQDGFLPPYRENMLVRAEQKIENLKPQIELLKRRERPLGITIASSGLRVDQKNHKMDWALVEIERHRFAGNFSPTLGVVDKEHKPARGKYRQSIEAPAVKTAAVNKGDWVIMKGRTSGVTTGIVHKIQMEVNDWETGNLKSTEIIIIHTNDNILENNPHVFSQEGDSGAWIFNQDGILVGQQIAHKKPVLNKPDLTVMTPINAIFQDIETMTKGKVRLPGVDNYPIVA